MAKPKRQVAIAASLGTSHALQPIKTNTDGKLDPSFLPMFGTAWPTSPADGQLYFKTDESEPELFFYDSTTSDWLSVERREFQFVASAPAGAAQWLEIGGAGATSNATPPFGYLMIHDMLVQGMSFAASGVAGTNFSYALRKNGPVTGVGLSHTTSISDGSDLTLSYEFAAGDIMGVRATNSVPAPAVVTVYARRRITP